MDWPNARRIRQIVLIVTILTSSFFSLWAAAAVERALFPEWQVDREGELRTETPTPSPSMVPPIPGYPAAHHAAPPVDEGAVPRKPSGQMGAGRSATPSMRPARQSSLIRATATIRLTRSATPLVDDRRSNDAAAEKTGITEAGAFGTNASTLTRTATFIAAPTAPPRSTATETGAVTMTAEPSPTRPTTTPPPEPQTTPTVNPPAEPVDVPAPEDEGTDEHHAAPAFQPVWPPRDTTSLREKPVATSEPPVEPAPDTPPEPSIKHGPAGKPVAEKIIRSNPKPPMNPPGHVGDLRDGNKGRDDDDDDDDRDRKHEQDKKQDKDRDEEDRGRRDKDEDRDKKRQDDKDKERRDKREDRDRKKQDGKDKDHRENKGKSDHRARSGRDRGSGR